MSTIHTDDSCSTNNMQECSQIKWRPGKSLHVNIKESGRDVRRDIGFK